MIPIFLFLTTQRMEMNLLQIIKMISYVPAFMGSSFLHRSKMSYFSAYRAKMDYT
jgi:hypothetical protein